MPLVKLDMNSRNGDLELKWLWFQCFGDFLHSGGCCCYGTSRAGNFKLGSEHNAFSMEFCLLTVVTVKWKIEEQSSNFLGFKLPARPHVFFWNRSCPAYALKPSGTRQRPAKTRYQLQGLEKR